MSSTLPVDASPDLERDGGFESTWNLYALVDPVLGDLPPDGMWNQIERRQVRVKHPDIPDSQRPYLLNASGLNAFRRQRFVDCFVEQAKVEACTELIVGISRPRTSCAVLLTPCSEVELVAQLALAATVVDATGVRRILRYWDPRVIQHLVVKEAGLTLNQVLPTLTARWFFVDAFGRLVQHEHRALDEDLHGGRPIVLQAAQGAWLNEVGALNACFERANARVLSKRDTWFELRACLKVALELGLTGADRVAFAANRYVLGAPIERAVRMQELIDDMRQHGLRYMTMQADFDAADWAEIVEQATIGTGNPEKTLQ